VLWCDHAWGGGGGGARACRGEGFSHFWLESLTRLAVMAPYIRAHPGIQVAVKDTTYSFVRPILELFGVRREDIASGPCCARRLYIPEPVACANPTAMHLAMLRREVHHALGVRISGVAGAAEPAWVRPLGQRTVLLLRRKGARAISNFEALRSALVARLAPAHEVIVFDGAAPVDALRMWYNCALAIGAHGAGFTHMVAARHPFSVVEFNIEELGLAFQHLTLKLGFEYGGFVPRGATHTGPMQVEVERAVQAVVEALARQQQLLQQQQPPLH
jgi:hypothetical protein